MNGVQIAGVSVGVLMASFMLAVILCRDKGCPCIRPRKPDDLELSLMDDDYTTTHRRYTTRITLDSVRDPKESSRVHQRASASASAVVIETSSLRNGMDTQAVAKISKPIVTPNSRLRYSVQVLTTLKRVSL